MKTDWILDTLADMRTFAVLNDMAELTRQIDITADVARRETHATGTAATAGRGTGAAKDLKAR